MSSSSSSFLLLLPLSSPSILYILQPSSSPILLFFFSSLYPFFFSETSVIRIYSSSSIPTLSIPSGRHFGYINPPFPHDRCVYTRTYTFLFTTMVASAPMNGAPIAEDNIINRRGGESLYQSCMNLKTRLAKVRGFEHNVAEMDDEDRLKDITDPVASLWNYLRNGYPLLALYNTIVPEKPVELDFLTRVAEAKRPKASTFKFLQACLQELHFPQQDCFLITDLYGDSTTGFIKVVKMVNRVLDLMESHGLLKEEPDVDPFPQHHHHHHQNHSMPANSGGKLSKKGHILKELLETERDYVHHLQNLQALKKELEETGALTGDASHQIFLNLNTLLDFAQVFLIHMEQHYDLPLENQNWGDLFIRHEETLQQYEPFISNQPRCDEECLKEWDKIHNAPRALDLQQMVALPATLNGFFVKPFQRLTKYPLMLSVRAIPLY